MLHVIVFMTALSVDQGKGTSGATSAQISDTRLEYVCLMNNLCFLLVGKEEINYVFYLCLLIFEDV